MQHTVETISAEYMHPTVCNTPQRRSPLCNRFEVKSSKFKKNLFGCITPWRQSLRSGAHRRDNLRCVQHTTETNCTPRRHNRNLHLSLVAFNETIYSIKGWITDKNFCLRGVSQNISLVEKLTMAKSLYTVQEVTCFEEFEFFI